MDGSCTPGSGRIAMPPDALFRCGANQLLHRGKNCTQRYDSRYDMKTT